MAKSLGAGFPMGAVWIRDQYADVLGAGSHGTTFGGTPLACAVALKTMEIVKRDRLDDNARNLGEWMKERLNGLVEKYSATLKEVRGVGLMLGVQLQDGLRAFSGAGDVPSLKATEAMADAGLILIPSGTHTLRFLPPLNLTQEEAERALTIFESVIKTIS
jgi:acetylornithine/succinyldiaminopimelate/putrescine aminotransferase